MLDRALLEESLSHHDRNGNIRERAQLLRWLHWTKLSCGELEAAIALAIRSRQDCISAGDTNGEAKASMGIGQARIAQGLFDEGMSFLRRAIEQLNTIGDAHCEAECLWLLGRAFDEKNLPDEAASHLDRALAMIREIGDRDDEFRVLIDRARVFIRRGAFEAAEEEAVAARDIARSLENREGEALAEIEHARAILGRGESAAAVTLARHAAGTLASIRSSECWRGWSVAGMAEYAAGEPAAKESLSKAVTHLITIRDQIDPADTRRRLEISRNRAAPATALSKLLIASGRTAESEEVRRKWTAG